MKAIDLVFVGKSSLLLHNGELANPLNPYTRKLNQMTKKGRGLKDEEHLEQIAKMEFAGSCYFTKNQEAIGIPGTVIFTVIRNGARSFRKGKDIEAGLLVPPVVFPLEYDGPKDWEELFNYTEGDDGFRPFVYQTIVAVQRNKVLRTRPRFDEWKLPITIEINENIISVDDLVTYAAESGIRHGIGDGRSLGFGRFDVEAS